MKLVDPMTVFTTSGHSLAEWMTLCERIEALEKRNTLLERALVEMKRMKITTDENQPPLVLH